MKILLTFLFLVCAPLAEAATYTVVTSTCPTLNLQGGGTQSIQSLAPGDTVAVVAGAILTGECLIDDSGTAASKITLTSADSRACSPDGYQTSVAYQPYMGIIQLPSGGNVALVRVAESTSHVVIKCLEIRHGNASTALYSTQPYICVGSVGCNGVEHFGATGLATQARHVWILKNYIHGNTGDQSLGAVADNGFGTLIKWNYMPGFHSAMAAETQVIGGAWPQYGHYHDNYLEGASETVFFGGDVNPCLRVDCPDLNYVTNHMTLTRNKFVKQTSWNPNHASHVPLTKWADISAVVKSSAGCDATASCTTVLTISACPSLQQSFVTISNVGGMTQLNTTTPVVASSWSCGGSPKTLTLPFLDSSGFSTYTSGGEITYPPMTKNCFETKGSTDLVMDGNTCTNSFYAVNASGGGQGTGFIFKGLHDTHGWYGHGDPISSVTNTNGVAVAINLTPPQNGIWNLVPFFDISGVTITSNPIPDTDTKYGYYEAVVTGCTGHRAGCGSTNAVLAITRNGAGSSIIGNGNAVTLRSWAISSSTNATPIVVTVPAHGVTVGNTIYGCISGHTTNTNANGCWQLVSLSSITLELTYGNTASEYNIQPHVSVGNGVGGASGTVGPAVWNHENRGPGQDIARVRVTNSYIAHTMQNGIALPIQAGDEFVSLPGHDWNERSADFLIYNNYIEDVSALTEGSTRNCGVPRYTGDGQSGLCSVYSDGDSLPMGGNSGSKRISIVHNTVFQYSPNQNGKLMNPSYVDNGPPFRNNIDTVRLQHNIIDLGVNGVGYASSPGSGFGMDDLATVIVNFTYSSNVLVGMDPTNPYQDCTRYNSLTTNIYWSTDANPILCTGSQAHIANSDMGYTSTAVDAQRWLTSSSLYKAGGARGASDGKCMGVIWRENLVARGLVPDSNIPSGC